MGCRPLVGSRLPCIEPNLFDGPGRFLSRPSIGIFQARGKQHKVCGIFHHSTRLQQEMEGSRGFDGHDSGSFVLRQESIDTRPLFPHWDPRAGIYGYRYLPTMLRWKLQIARWKISGRSWVGALVSWGHCKRSKRIVTTAFVESKISDIGIDVIDRIHCSFQRSEILSRIKRFGYWAAAISPRSGGILLYVVMPLLRSRFFLGLLNLWISNKRDGAQ